MITKEEALQVINALPNDFDSHEFIEKYLTIFERSYLNMLVENIDCDEVFKTVNSKIGRFLSVENLGITKVDRVVSQNVRGNVTDNQRWRKVL